MALPKMGSVDENCPDPRSENFKSKGEFIYVSPRSYGPRDDNFCHKFQQILE